jgi:hypothetical protein
MTKMIPYKVERTKSLIYMCSKTKIPMVPLEKWTEEKSLSILKYLDNFDKRCMTDVNKCSHFKNGCSIIGVCIWKSSEITT